MAFRRARYCEPLSCPVQIDKDSVTVISCASADIVKSAILARRVLVRNEICPEEISYYEFEWSERTYRVPSSDFENIIKLPHGVYLKVTSWLEMYPKRIDILEEIKHIGLEVVKSAKLAEYV